MPQTCGWKEQNYGNLIYVLNFGLDKIGEFFPNSTLLKNRSAPGRGRFFQAASFALLQIQTTQSITWKKKGLLK